MIYSDLIKQKTVINENSPNSELNAFLCFNDKYSLQAGVTVTSLLEHNPDITIHLFMIDVSHTNKTLFSELASYGRQIIMYDINAEIISKKHTLKDRHIPTCLRIFVPELLQEHKKLVYLDSDIVCLSTLMPLLDIDFQDNIAIVIKDDESSQETQCELFNIPYGKYFNAGVMIINTENWHNNNITNKTMELLDHRRKEFRLLDQDALNITLNHKTILIPEHFNNIVGLSNHALTEAIDDKDVLLHFAGPIKPWFIDTIPPVYERYFSLSPWRSIQLGKSAKESPSIYRVKAKDEFKKKNFIAAFKCYLTYLSRKLQNNKS